jgi:hypothetical protein
LPRIWFSMTPGMKDLAYHTITHLLYPDYMQSNLRITLFYYEKQLNEIFCSFFYLLGICIPVKRYHHILYFKASYESYFLCGYRTNQILYFHFLCTITFFGGTGFFLYSFIHMCIHCLCHFSPLPLIFVT